MFKIKKKAEKPKMPTLYNIIEDYTEFDPPGNVTVCAMTQEEDVPAHAKILSESYAIPFNDMMRVLTEGGIYVYPDHQGIVTSGLFACRLRASEAAPKQTWVLDVVQFAEAEQLARSMNISLEEASYQVFTRTLPDELQQKLKQKNLGLDYRTMDRTVTKWGDVKYIDFRKDWSPHFKRLCIMPDGRLVETGGIAEFAALHNISVAQAKTLLAEGGTLEIDGEVLACQLVNGQPSVARFNARQYARAKELVSTKGFHLMDALSEVGYSDPAMMRGLKQKELGSRT